MSPSPPPPPPNFCTLLSELKRIVLAQPRHFLGLSLLFLFPLSLFNNVYYQFQIHSQTLLRHHSPTPSTSATANTTASIILPLVYGVVVLFLSLLALGSISFSAYHGFFGRPVKLVSSILSLLRSFLPMLFTCFASLLIQYLILFVFGLVLFSIIGFEFIGFKIILILALLVLVYLQVNWALAYVIVVVESSWGFEPLRRSTKLVKGMRGLILSMLVFNGICSVLLLLGCSFLSNEFDGDIRSWNSWSFVLQIVVSTTGGMVLMLQYFLANTVLYIYCKAMHGEVAGEIAEEFASLPFDDGKVYHVVSVIPTSELGMPRGLNNC